MRAPRALIAASVVALIAVAAACAWWVTDTARSSIRAQFVAREAAAATERAAQVADVVNVAVDRLSALSSLPNVASAVARADGAFLQPALDAGTRSPTIAALTVTAVDGTVLAHSPSSAPPVLVDGDQLRLDPLPNDDAALTVGVPIKAGGGTVVGRVHEQLRMSELMPRFRVPVAGGAVPRLVTSAVRARPGHITATAAVPGRSWTVVIEAPNSAADAPADTLAKKLLGGFAITFLVGAALLAGIAAAVIRTRRHLEAANQRAVHDATTDALTNARNRRAFDTRLEAVRQTASPVGVVLVDLDELKTINDSRGHAAGDVAIRSVADAIRTSVRAGDDVYRIGGDEFVVVLEGAGLTDVDRLAERIVASVEAAGEARVSVGGAVGTGKEVDDTLRHADAAMYRAKAVRTGSG